MNDLSGLKQLQEVAKNFNILYVEDNESLRANAHKLLKKFFHTVYVGVDGMDGLELFKEHHPAVVITDIKMPKLDGMLMAKKIRHISPDTKIILMSAFDEKDYLYQAIEIGIYRFMKKPVNVTELSTVLYQAILQIRHEKQEKMFQAQLGNIFNYQSSMIVMMKENKPLLANQQMLDFYDVEDIDEFNEKYPDFGSKFLEHDGFLYNTKDTNWIYKVLEDRRKIFNVKMQDRYGDMKHFVLKCQDIPDKAGYGILSFDDVSGLNLLELFDENKITNDKVVQNKKAMFDYLSVIHRNNANLSLHNYYKGISITNDAVILEIKNNSIVLKTSYTQQKIIQHEKKTLLSSEALPYPILSSNISNIIFDKQTIELNELEFAEKTPITRETVRLYPEEGHTVSMFMGETKYAGELSILDISVKSTRLSLSVLPAGFEIGSQVVIDMVFTLDNRPLIINTKARLFKKREVNLRFELVFMFDLDAKTRAILIKYITKRQMLLIREFKGLQNAR